MTWIKKMEMVRAARGWTRRSLADRAGVEHNTLEAWVRRGNFPKSDEGLRVATALGVSCEWLFGDDGGDGSIEPPQIAQTVKSDREMMLMQVRGAAEFLASTEDATVHLTALRNSALGLLQRYLDSLRSDTNQTSHPHEALEG